MRYRYLVFILLCFTTLLNAKLLQPANLKLIATNSSVKLSWNDTNIDEVGYKIFRDGILLAITPKDSQSYTDDNLIPNTLYRYTVRATDSDENISDVKKQKIVFGYHHFHQMTKEIDKDINWSIYTHIGWHYLTLKNDNSVDKKVKLFTFKYLDSSDYDEQQLIWPTKDHNLEDLRLKYTKSRLDMLHDKGLKIYIGVQVSDEVSSKNLADKEWRRQAIKLLISAMLRGNADGLDIDIENDLVDVDKDNLLESKVRIENLYNFIKELRFALDKEKLYDKAINIAAPIHFGYLNNFKDSPIKKIIAIVDSYFVMGYDVLWISKASSHSLFQWSSDLNDDEHSNSTDYGWSVKRAIEDLTKGIDERFRSKIILGVPYYSYKFTTYDGNFASKKLEEIIDKDTQKIKNGWGGDDISFYEIENIIKERDLNVNYDKKTQSVWIAWMEDSKWYQSYFENEQTLKVKYDFINNKKLGGVGFWSIGEYQNPSFDKLVMDYFK